MSKQKQRGGFAMGLIVGLLLGLGIALGVALYVTKAPVPFLNKLPQRTAEQDAQEAERNRNWDPNAPLAGRAGAKPGASGVVTPAPGTTAPAPATAPTATAPAPSPMVPTTAIQSAPPAPGNVPPAVAGRPIEKPAERAANGNGRAASAAAAAGGNFFVQAGAYTRPEDAEQQRAKLAIQGFAAKVMEREQSGRTVYRVRMGPFDTRDEAEGQQKKLEAAGVEANLVAVR